MTTSRNTIEIAIQTPGSEAAVQEFQEVRRAIAELQGVGVATGQSIEASLGTPPSEEVRVFDQHLGELVQTLHALQGTMGQVSTAVTQLPEDLRKVGREAADTEKKVAALHERLDKAGSEMQDIGGKLTVGITAPLALIGGVSLKSAMGFEQAMVGVQKTTDITGEDLERLGGQFKALSELPGRPAAAQLAGIAEAAGQLGIANTALLEFTQTMAALDVSTNLGGEEGAAQLARFANITRMQQSEFDRLGSVVVALGSAGASTERQILDMGLRIAGAGEQVGMTEAQILGVANALSSLGIEAEAGGTAISSVIVDMANAVASGGDQLQRFAAVAGMSTAEFRALFQQDSAQGLVSFIEGLKRVSDAGGNVFSVLEKLGLAEDRVRDTLLRAANAGDLFRESLVLGSRAWEENLALTKEAEQFYNTAQGDLQAFLNTVSNVASEFGTALIPAMKDGLEVFRALIVPIRTGVELFSELPEPVRLTVASVLALSAATGPTVYIVGTFVQTLSGIVAVGPKVVSAIAAIRGGTALAGLATSLVPGGAVLIGLGLLVTEFHRVRSAAKDAAEESAEAVRTMKEAVAGMQVASAEARFAVVSDELDRVTKLEGRLKSLRQQYKDAPVGDKSRGDIYAGIVSTHAELRGSRDRDLILDEWRQLVTRLTDLRNEAASVAASPSPGLGPLFGDDGKTELDRLKDQSSRLTAVFQSMKERGEDTTAVFVAILDLNRQIEASIRKQGGALTEYNVAIRGISGDLAKIVAPTFSIDLSAQRFTRPDLTDSVIPRTSSYDRNAPARELARRARQHMPDFGDGLVGPRIPKKGNELDAAGRHFDQAATVAISSLGAMAQAAVAGTAQMEAVMIQGFANIAAAAVGASSPWGAAIVAVGGVLGALFGRRNQRDVVPVRLEEYSSRALSQQKQEGPEVVILRIISPDTGETLAETRYQMHRNERRDATVRIPKSVRYG